MFAHSVCKRICLHRHSSVCTFNLQKELFAPSVFKRNCLHVHSAKGSVCTFSLQKQLFECLYIQSAKGSVCTVIHLFARSICKRNCLHIQSAFSGHMASSLRVPSNRSQHVQYVTVNEKVEMAEANDSASDPLRLLTCTWYPGIWAVAT